MVDSLAAPRAAKWIATSVIQEGKYLYGVEDHVRELVEDLKCIQLFLQDVDEVPRRLTSQDSQLVNCAQVMQNLAFRAEDAIDTYVIDVGAKVYRKNLFLKIACLLSHSYPVHMLIREIEAIQQEIQNANKRFETFGKIPKTPGDIGSVGPSQPSRTENYIHLDDEVVVGIDDDISRLAKRLTEPDDDFKVLAIVGIGGGGKTTLATELYRHTKVKSRFPHKAFVSISQQWSRIDVLRRIFKEAKVNDVIPSDEKDLVSQLHEFLKDKQCLIVLDDMWEKQAWDDIYPALPRSNKGCRVIITTRIGEVPMHADTRCVIHEPKLLTKDQKWELFSKIATEGRVGIENNDEFARLGRQMLEKCKGLPLAVVTLAGVLRTKKEWYQWEAISKAYAECILEGSGTSNYGSVEDALTLSYLHLPTYLKPCFLYFSLFLEDWTFQADDLIGMWIAEGFVTDDLKKGQETLEDAAMLLLEDLAQQFIIRVTFRNTLGQIQEFRMHDLMRDFCIKKAKEYQFAESVSSDVRESRQPRRVIVLPRKHYPKENDHLRTLFSVSGDEELPSGAREDLDSIPNKFKLLRVLYIRGQEYVALPDQIGNLIHLRYLSITRSKILVLPKSIKKLRNLLCLVYETTNESDVVEVPDDLVANMENLRGLSLPMCIKRGSLNRLGLNGPKNLQRLATGAGTWMKNELPTLRKTVTDFRIYNIQKKEEMEALYQCSGIMEDTLRRLRPKYYPWLSSEPPEAMEFDLEKLRNCTSLWDLDLDCPLTSNSEGTILYFPPNLVRVFLYRTRIKERDDLMQVLGELPKLKSLNLSLDAYVGKKLSCTANGFSQLEKLELREMSNLEEWIMEEGAMARLGRIWLDDCRNLKRLPERIRDITTLKELKITRMPEEFCRKIGYELRAQSSWYEASNTEAEHYNIIQHIPSVIVSVQHC